MERIYQQRLSFKELLKVVLRKEKTESRGKNWQLERRKENKTCEILRIITVPDS